MNPSEQKIDDSKSVEDRELIVILERTAERAIWVWLSISLTFLLAQVSFSQQHSPGIIQLAWLVYSGVLIFWTQMPLKKLRARVKTTFTSKDGERIYMEACGYRETFQALAIVVGFTLVFVALMFVL